MDGMHAPRTLFLIDPTILSYPNPSGRNTQSGFTQLRM